MSKTKNQYKHNKKDLHSYDDNNISYRNTPEYLKQLLKNQNNF